MDKLEKRLLELCYKHKLSHISSYLTCLPVIDHIYKVKKANEPFILSNGHAFAALAVVLEKHVGKDAEKLIKKHGTHPNRCKEDRIWCSTGSLGQGLTVAVGMALADRTRNVYVLVSDGELAEGSCWEALAIAGDLRLENLRVTVVANGLSAYGRVDADELDMRLQLFYPTLMIKSNLYNKPGFLQGVNGHYVVMNKEQYEEVMKE